MMKQLVLSYHLYLCWIALTSNLCTVYANDYEEQIHSRRSRSAVFDHYEQSAQTVIDNHFPSFPNCAQYKPTVLEEQGTGTPVIRVKAYDPDPPTSKAGNLTYDLVADPSDIKFTIDKVTGEITTKKMLDRDEPIRDQVLHVLVRAKDDGKPQLDAYCSFTVTVQDINDNAPIFDRAKYEEFIPQDSEVNRTVMRISATDIDDGPNKDIVYSIESADDGNKYFSINENNGILTLNKKIDKEVGHVFKIKAWAKDKNPAPRSSDVNLIITVIESNKKAPSFVNEWPNPIHLKENFTDRTKNIVTFKARSNTDERAPIFILIPNKKEADIFALKTQEDTAYLRLSSPSLDYETVKNYTLTIRIENKHKLATEQTVTIIVDDVNDVAPKFMTGGKKGISSSVFENEPVGTPVMQVSAVDLDEIPEYKEITYSLQNYADKFEIDPKTGNITTKVMLDREEQDSYILKVLARDGAPSSNSEDQQPNTGEQDFRIDIADKNDHPPYFKSNYSADVPENIDIKSVVVEVRAHDNDSASTIKYSIISGNEGDAFDIEPDTGKIIVKNKLDYEKVTSYNLMIEANDGIYNVSCVVSITVINVNDNPPVFLQSNWSVTIPEETPMPDCILNLTAYDPDVPDRNAFQDIVYSVYSQGMIDFVSIDSNGCLSLKKGLDRDPATNGSEQWSVSILAQDEGGKGKQQVTQVLIKLTDINDNAPVLKMSQPVIWQENQDHPATIVKLQAEDYDGPGNGEPFTFELVTEADPTILEKFRISGSYLEAKVRFDREEQKEYYINIAITDSGTPSKTGDRILKVIIGDENDNAMTAGSSSIFVYYFEGFNDKVDIGRVYVTDPDDWDLSDKKFEWEFYGEEISNYFTLDSDTGMITMLAVPSPSSYSLRFKVTEDPKIKYFQKHTVSADVNVTVKAIPEEAISKSGSIRFSSISANQFITRDENGRSKMDILKSLLAGALNNSENNIDVFTVLHSPVHNNDSELDVRFSSHGSPYYPSEMINVAVVKIQDKIEKVMDAKMLMVNVDECLIENKHCEASCVNELIANSLSPVYTNRTSFIGIKAYVNFSCVCKTEKPVCLNGGVVTPDGRCQCLDASEGATCEHTSIGFSGNGWALYPTFSVCQNTSITVYFRSLKKDGLIFYVGPDSIYSSFMGVQDFISLEIRKGCPTLRVNYGTGTVMIQHVNCSLAYDKFQKIDILLSTTKIELIVDNYKYYESPIRPNQYLNVNGPLQIGGTHMDLKLVAQHHDWLHGPSGTKFNGCIQNFTFNGKAYDLRNPSMLQNADFGCSKEFSSAIVVGVDWTFWIAILICLAIFTVFLTAVAVHRRKVEDWYGDTDDIRENIINYEDEGGGEGDMTGYDLNVLRLHYDGPVDKNQKYLNGMLPSIGMEEVPDMCGFLDDKKHSVDNDPETLPFDNVRQYAYEGDGNTTGSLSSLASGTDEGDLNFDYLSNFGPRFRKLADMYGEDASDEDSDTYHNATSESWC